MSSNVSLSFLVANMDFSDPPRDKRLSNDLFLFFLSEPQLNDVRNEPRLTPPWPSAPMRFLMKLENVFFGAPVKLPPPESLALSGLVDEAKSARRDTGLRLGLCPRSGLGIHLRFLPILGEPPEKDDPGIDSSETALDMFGVRSLLHFDVSLSEALG
jgi:hypothetical protein